MEQAQNRPYCNYHCHLKWYHPGAEEQLRKDNGQICNVNYLKELSSLLLLWSISFRKLVTCHNLYIGFTFI